MTSLETLQHIQILSFLYLSTDRPKALTILSHKTTTKKKKPQKQPTKNTKNTKHKKRFKEVFLGLWKSTYHHFFLLQSYNGMQSIW